MSAKDMAAEAARLMPLVQCPEERISLRMDTGRLERGVIIRLRGAGGTSGVMLTSFEDIALRQLREIFGEGGTYVTGDGRIAMAIAGTEQAGDGIWQTMVFALSRRGYDLVPF